MDRGRGGEEEEEEENDDDDITALQNKVDELLFYFMNSVGAIQRDAEPAAFDAPDLAGKELACGGRTPQGTIP